MEKSAQEFILRHADFFRRLMSGEDTDPCWNDWWNAHRAEMQIALSRGQYLRLAHTPEAELRNILHAVGIPFQEAPTKWLSRWYEPERSVYAEGPIPVAWLQRPLPLEEIRRPDHKLPPEIRLLKQLMRPDDEIWTFDSGGDTWANKMGRVGLALVRNGVPVASLTTLVS